MTEKSRTANIYDDNDEGGWLLKRGRTLLAGILAIFLCFHGTVMAAGMLVKEGERGEDVRRVQILLISRGYLSGEADGICGKDTVEAILRFQKDAGLETDGVCGQATFDLLEAKAKEAEAAEAVNGREVSVGEAVKMGMRGPGVAYVQELLIAKGYLSGEADGVCGSRTAGAIAKFQRESGLTADGVCGPATYAALQGEAGEISFGGEDTQEESGEASGVDEFWEHPMADKGHVVYVVATAYSAYDPGNTHHTARGTRVRKGVIAVDPSFIPLGTKVYIPGYGEAVAEDTGRSIRGNRIDIAFDSYEEALAFGRQDVELYIIE